MRNYFHFTLILAGVALVCVLLTSTGTTITSHAQPQRPDPQTPDKVVISKNEVPFDVVVRDMKGTVSRL